ncbi:hypothetical protein RB4802 [Rhodopirellula baltica SH 1]|uniref:Uncharacterized protein n=1 Tax=Rhodopirellula baltica (strain DSM 10527 / NCIMB 13988 / SH1) TaxID=243090 RepID=Q7UH73_RHOBA|nr:hypothetical protein RB4802 [Rhodopirellula baltica SH 1]
MRRGEDEAEEKLPWTLDHDGAESVTISVCLAPSRTCECALPAGLFHDERMGFQWPLH